MALDLDTYTEDSSIEVYRVIKYTEWLKMIKVYRVNYEAPILFPYSASRSTDN